MKKINRNQVLIASTIILLCTGAVYSFSVFAGPLGQQHHWTMSEIMMAFTINSAISPIPMILGGFFTDKGWSKISITVGGILFGLGFFLTGIATSLTSLYLFYGIIAGFGQGLAYSGCLSNTIKLFPDKRGLASGIITAGMGGATIIAAPIANYLIQHQGVSSAFKVLGAAYVVIVAVASIFIKNAPNEEVENSTAKSKNDSKNVDWKHMLLTPQFYLIFLMLFSGAFSGLMIASNASIIGQNMFALNASTAAFFVSLYSLSNCLGRVVWGTVSDKIGRNKTLNIILFSIILAFCILVLLSGTSSFAIGIIILGLCFGGVMGVFPPMVMENYGPRNQGVNYGIVFTGYSLAAFFGPKVAANMAATNNGNFTMAFYVAIGIAVVGVVINSIYIKLSRNK